MHLSYSTVFASLFTKWKVETGSRKWKVECPLWASVPNCAKLEGCPKPGLRPLSSLRIVGRGVLTGPSALAMDRREGRPNRAFGPSYGSSGGAS